MSFTGFLNEKALAGLQPGGKNCFSHLSYLLHTGKSHSSIQTTEISHYHEAGKSSVFVKSLTNDGLHIFGVICDIEKLSSTESIVQRLLKGSKVVENLRGHQGSKCSTPKCLILIQDLAVSGQGCYIRVKKWD